MPLPRDENDRARLEINARAYRYDPVLDRAADLIDSDREAWNRLPASLQSQSVIHRDFRNYYRDAVAAGVVRDDRGPSAA
jgi:hypothetical protein